MLAVNNDKFLIGIKGDVDNWRTIIGFNIEIIFSLVVTTWFVTVIYKNHLIIYLIIYLNAYIQNKFKSALNIFD